MKKKTFVLWFAVLLTVLGISGCSSTDDITQSTIYPQTEETTVSTNVEITRTETPTPVTTEKPTMRAAEPEINSASDLEVHFIDVGQADAILLFSDGHYMLIDGGNAADSNLIYSYLDKLGITYLDYIIGTHAHEDHMGGLSGALQKADVGTVYIPRTESDAKFYHSFMSKLSAKGIVPVNPVSGTSFDFGNCSVQLLCPKYERADDLNNTSIMAKVLCGNTSFLFTGDAESDEEHDILSQRYDLSATVLKAGHHGSETSSSYSFLREVMPRYVVISVGTNNSYGHPDENALSRFRDVGAKTYRTDLQGDIIFTSNGSEINITTQKNANADTNPTISQSSENSQTAQAENDESQYIGNKNSKKFHRPSCKSLPAEKNRVYFNSRDEAITSGYSGCKNCNP